jgi:hypothetical protein
VSTALPCPLRIQNTKRIAFNEHAKHGFKHRLNTERTTGILTARTQNITQLLPSPPRPPPLLLLPQEIGQESRQEKISTLKDQIKTNFIPAFANLNK